MAIECYFVRAAKALASLHICKSLPRPLSLKKSHVLPKMAICVLFTSAANTLVSLHICAGIVTGQCDNDQDLLC